MVKQTTFVQISEDKRILVYNLKVESVILAVVKKLFQKIF